MFSFVHTSDIHFGAGRRLTPKSLDYLDRHIRHLDEVRAVADKYKVDFTLVSGDIFEDSGTTKEELLAAYEWFKVLSQIAPVVCTVGNHDELAIGEFQDKYLSRLDLSRVHFVSSPKVVRLGTRSGASVAVLAVPWTGIKVQQEFDDLITKHLEPDIEIVMLHECFLGITTDVGYKAIKGIQVPNISQVRYFACGDIHKMQRLNLPHAWMCGAPLQYNFGDRPGKGVLLVEAEPHGVYDPKFIKIPSHIELHQVNDLAQIPENSPHWFKLVCEANRVPSAVPPNVKVVEPIPIKIDLPAPTPENLESGKPYLSIDYAEGVDLMMQEMGYGPEEIDAEMKFIREQVQI